MMARSSRLCVRTERRSEEGTSCRATIAAKRPLDDGRADRADHHDREHDQRCHRLVALHYNVSIKKSVDDIIISTAIRWLKKVFFRLDFSEMQIVNYKVHNTRCVI